MRLDQNNYASSGIYYNRQSPYRQPVIQLEGQGIEKAAFSSRLIYFSITKKTKPL